MNIPDLRNADHMPPQPFGVGLTMEMTEDGPDYTRFCDAHNWASHAAAKAEETGRCPYCAVQMDNAHGLTRWLRLKGRMAGQS